MFVNLVFTFTQFINYLTLMIKIAIGNLLKSAHFSEKAV